MPAKGTKITDPNYLAALERARAKAQVTRMANKSVKETVKHAKQAQQEMDLEKAQAILQEYESKKKAGKPAAKPMKPEQESEEEQEEEPEPVKPKPKPKPKIVEHDSDEDEDDPQPPQRPARQIPRQVPQVPQAPTQAQIQERKRMIKLQKLYASLFG